MLSEVQETNEVVARVAALDIGKAELVCCARVPGQSQSGRRVQEVQTYSTMTRSLLQMSDRLRDLAVTRVVMEATSDYWRPAFYLLEAAGFDVWLVNANDVKHLPGRPKTDKLDAVWLAKVAERQMIRASFVPPREIRALRDLTRYRVDLVAARTSEKQRVEKLLEDALIKLSAVATDIFGPSGRDMLDALVAGERDPKVLAQLARRRLRAKLAALEAAFTSPRGGSHRAVRDPVSDREQLGERTVEVIHLRPPRSKSSSFTQITVRTASRVTCQPRISKHQPRARLPSHRASSKTGFLTRRTRP